MHIYSVLYLFDAGLTCPMLACRLLGMLICITRCLYITLGKLVFTSHCVCFHYIVICPVSSANSIGVIAFEQFIISVILFSTLFANGMEICSTSAAHMPLVLSCYVIPVHWLLTLSRSLFWLFVSCLVC